MVLMVKYFAEHKIEVKIITPQLLEQVGGELDEALTAEQAQSVESLVVKLMVRLFLTRTIKNMPSV